jgi:hypothetical protein
VYLGRLFGLSVGGVCKRREPLWWYSGEKDIYV